MGLRHTKMNENAGNSSELVGTLGTQRNLKPETWNLKPIFTGVPHGSTAHQEG